MLSATSEKAGLNCVHGEVRIGRAGGRNACNNREGLMIRIMRTVGATALVVASCLAGQAPAEAKQLTLCWAAWDPANALVELGKDFTTKTGIEMKYEFVPWTSYADRFLNESGVSNDPFVPPEVGTRDVAKR